MIVNERIFCRSIDIVSAICVGVTLNKGNTVIMKVFLLYNEGLLIVMEDNIPTKSSDSYFLSLLFFVHFSPHVKAAQLCFFKSSWFKR